MALLRICQVLGPLRQEREEALRVQFLPVLQHYPLISEPNFHGPAVFASDKEPECATPAQAALALIIWDGHTDVIRMCGVLLRDVPDLEARGIGTDGGRDAGIRVKPAPALVDVGLALRPLLQDESAKLWGTELPHV